MRTRVPDFTTRQALARIALDQPRGPGYRDQLRRQRHRDRDVAPHRAGGRADWQTHIMAFRRGSSGWVAEPAFTYLSKQPSLQPGFSDEFATVARP